MEQPRLMKIKSGWAAVGQGWAVHGLTEEDARREFAEAERRHAEIDKRSPYYERMQRADNAQF